MATRTWNSSGSTDMNDGNNYTPTGAILAVDDLVFNNTSVVNATATADLSVNSVTTAANYSGNWSISGRTLTCAQGASWDGTGTLNLGNGVTANGASATVHIGSGVGTVTATSCVLTLAGTTGMTFDDDKGVGFSKYVHGVSAIVTSTGAGTTSFSAATAPWTFTNGGTWTNNALTVVNATGNTKLITVTAGSPTIAGSQTFIIRNDNSGGVTSTIDGFNATGTIRISNNRATTDNVSLNSAITGSAALQIYNTAANSIINFNTSNNNITCGSLSIGSNSATGTMNFTQGSSTISCTSYVGSAYNTGTVNINRGTGVLEVKGNFVNGTNHTITPGTSQLRFNTNGATINTAGKTEYDIQINGAGQTYSLATSAVTCRDFIITEGIFSCGGNNITASGDVTFGGTGNLTLACTLTMTGNAKTITISTSGTKTLTNLILVCQGTSNALDLCNHAAVSISRLLTKTAGQTITWTPRSTRAVTISNYTAADWGGSAGNLVKWRSTSSGTQYYISAPASIDLSYMDIQDCYNSGSQIDADNGTNVVSNSYGFLFPTGGPFNLYTQMKVRVGFY